MAFASRPPADWLAPYVERLWAFSDRAAHSAERIVPTGTIELVVNLDHDEIRVCRDGDRVPVRYAGAVVSGAYSRSFAIDARAHRSIVGVHFRPGGAAPFLGLPVDELADAHVDLVSIWGPTATQVRDALCSAGTTGARFDLLEAALHRRLVPTRERLLVVSAVASLARSADGVRALVRGSGLSHRRFVEVFAAHVGMSPKRFGRVSRFQRALAAARGASPRWSEIALASGYVDQSHLIRDFRDFTGTTPVEHTRARSDALLENHVLADTLMPPRERHARPRASSAATLPTISSKTRRASAP